MFHKYLMLMSYIFTHRRELNSELMHSGQEQCVLQLRYRLQENRNRTSSLCIILFGQHTCIKFFLCVCKLGTILGTSDCPDEQ